MKKQQRTYRLISQSDLKIALKRVILKKLFPPGINGSQPTGTEAGPPVN